MGKKGRRRERCVVVPVWLLAYCCLPARGVRASGNGDGVESAAWKRILGEP